MGIKNKYDEQDVVVVDAEESAVPDRLYARDLGAGPFHLQIVDSPNPHKDPCRCYGEFDLNPSLYRGQFTTAPSFAGTNVEEVVVYTLEPAGYDSTNNGFGHHPKDLVIKPKDSSQVLAMAAWKGGMWDDSRFHVRMPGDRRYWRLNFAQIVNCNVTVRLIA